MPIRMDPGVAREVIDALLDIEAAEAGRRFLYTIATESDAPAVGTGEHSGYLVTHANDSLTIGTEAGQIEIGWYEITSIRVAAD